MIKLIRKPGLIFIYKCGSKLCNWSHTILHKFLFTTVNPGEQIFPWAWICEALGATYVQHLQPHQFEALLLEALDDVTDQAPLHAVRLDGNECALRVVGHFSGNHTEEVKFSQK